MKRNTVIEGYKEPGVETLRISNRALQVITAMGCYTTVRSMRENLHWYDNPELKPQDIDLLCKELGISQGRIDARFDV